MWAPRYGLKGMIDASVWVRTDSNVDGPNEKIMPLEFKTGKGTSGQASFYYQPFTDLGDTGLDLNLNLCGIPFQAITMLDTSLLPVGLNSCLLLETIYWYYSLNTFKCPNMFVHFECLFF